MIKSLIIIFFFFFCTLNLHAQQTIFNVPSADVVKEGVIFLEHESQFSDDFGLFTNYGAYGIGKNTEIDLTLFGVGTRQFRDEVLGIGFKTSLPIYKNDTKFTFGHLIPVSLMGNGVGGYSYGHFSSVIPKLKTRITSGVLVATTTIFGRDTVSFIGGIEQPITRKFSALLDWTSGRHANGLLIVGGSYAFNESNNFYFGYQIPNYKKVGDDGFVIEYAKFFY